MKSVLINKIVLILIALVVVLGSANAQLKEDVATTTDLYNEIKLQDSLLFAAFNTRDIETFKNYFSEDLEFFHDIGGLTGYDVTINFLKTTAQQKSDLKRELVKGSLEVFPIPGYGAMEIGSHQFCHTENGSPPDRQGKDDCGTFKFVQIWQKKDDQWKITRVVSYGH
ncbi:MAG: nuclear transport factor 2 family protein [Chitinophagaceae bacterium]|nr:nuclear transport factor 2 family protein [Chitinophagaceae bacterium]